MTVTRLNPPSLPDTAAIGYSQISVATPGRLAFVSGQVAIPPEGGPVPDGLAEQAALVVDNCRRALAALDATPADIVIARIYAVDLTPERLDLLMPVIAQLFDGAAPSLTGIGVAALAAPAFQLEVEMTVQLPA